IFYRAQAEILLLRAKTPSAKLTDARSVRVQDESAKSVYEVTHRQFVDGRGYPETLYEWSSYWRESSMLLAGNKKDKESATEAHLSRMKELKKLVKDHIESNKAPARWLFAANYYLAEAEQLFDEVKASE